MSVAGRNGRPQVSKIGDTCVLTEKINIDKFSGFAFKQQEHNVGTPKVLKLNTRKDAW